MFIKGGNLLIYSYIEKGILRRSIIIIQLFLKNKIWLDDLIQELEVSHMTVRNDLLYFSEHYSSYIDDLYTRSGKVKIHFKNEIDLCDILCDLLGQSLFLRYLFLALMEETISARLISNRENISFSSAHKLFLHIQQFIEEEALKENEGKKRMVLICLSRYIPLDTLSDIFDPNWLTQATEITNQILGDKTVHKLNQKQLMVAIYLYFDRATLYQLEIQKQDFTHSFSMDEIKVLVPPLGLSEEEQEAEIFFLSLMVYYLSESDIHNPLTSIHPNIQLRLESHPEFQKLRELVFDYFPLNHSVFQTHLFYYVLQKFLTFQKLGFPLQLAFSKTYLSDYLQQENYQQFLISWEMENPQYSNNEDILFEFFYYLELLEDYNNIHKYIYIVSPTREHFHMIYNILTTLIQNQMIIIDHHHYHSVEEIPKENQDQNTIIVCDRHIREQQSTQIIPFSFNHLNEDLLEIHRKIYNIDEESKS